VDASTRIGAGNVIFEIQQNSDTTYRVFDWNRVGLDGNRGKLHIPQALASIDFHDLSQKLSFGANTPAKPVMKSVIWSMTRCSGWTVARSRGGQRFTFKASVQIVGCYGPAHNERRRAGVLLKPRRVCRCFPAACSENSLTAETAVEYCISRPENSRVSMTNQPPMHKARDASHGPSENCDRNLVLHSHRLLGCAPPVLSPVNAPWIVAVSCERSSARQIRRSASLAGRRSFLAVRSL